MLLIELMMNRGKGKEMANSWWIAVSKWEKWTWNMDSVKNVHRNCRDERIQKGRDQGLRKTWKWQVQEKEKERGRKLRAKLGKRCVQGMMRLWEGVPFIRKSVHYSNTSAYHWSSVAATGSIRGWGHRGLSEQLREQAVSQDSAGLTYPLSLTPASSNSLLPTLSYHSRNLYWQFIVEVTV